MSRLDGRVSRLEEGVWQANHPGEKEAEALLLDALRRAGRGECAPTDDPEAIPLGELLAGTRAGDFLAALSAVGEGLRQAALAAGEWRHGLTQ